MSVRVIAVGRELRGDDAAAFMLVETLRENPVPGVELVCSDGDVVELLDLFQGQDAVIVLDAYEANPNDPPVMRLDAGKEMLPSTPACSSHGLGVAEAVEMAREMGLLPATCIMIAIAGYAFATGSPPSGGLKKRLRMADHLLRKELERMVRAFPMHEQDIRTGI